MSHPSAVVTDFSLATSVLRLAGVVDVGVAVELHRAARATLDRGVGARVACSEVERWDTSALQILLALHTGLCGRLSLDDVPAKPAAQLRLAGLERLLPARESSELSKGTPS